MPFSIRPFLLLFVLVVTFPALVLYLPTLVHAETKTIVSDTTYIMGDGESPSFAEAPVLQRTKHAALEQAGTYVEAYTKTQNYDLTIKEIQTLEGGAMKVKVRGKTRTLVGEGLRFYTKTKATVPTDKMQELAQRIRGKNRAEHYKKLEAEYAKLLELEIWKQVTSGPAIGTERQTALDRIKENKKIFAQVQANEATLFRRLLSGQALIAQAQDTKVAIGGLIDDIVVAGHEIIVGRVSVTATEREAKLALKWFPWGNWPLAENEYNDADGVTVSIPITVRASPSLAGILTDAARSFGGKGILPPQPDAHNWEQTVLSYNFGYNDRMQIEETIVLSHPLAQVEQRFGLRGVYAGSLDTRVEGTEFLLSGNRNISGDFQQELADLALDISLSIDDDTKYSCAAYSMVNRLVPVRAGGAWVNTNLSDRKSNGYNKVLLLNNAISFEVEFALSEKMVTHLKGAEARYVRSNQAPKERCKMILPKE
jgi:hypothetical protein